MLIALLLTCCLNTPLDVTIDASTITLGAIVQLPASDPRAAVSLGYAPNPGLARRIPNYEILSKIQAAGFSTDGLQFPDSILVHRRAQPLDETQIRRAVLDTLSEQFPGAKIELLDVETPATQVGTGEVSVSASLPANFDPGGQMYVKLDIRSAGAIRTAFVRVTARIETIQPILKTKIAANSEVRPEDLEWRIAPLEGGRKVFASPQEFEGMLTKSEMEAGQILKPDTLYMPLFVRKGDSVTVRATSGGVTVSATMRAKAAGRLGELVPVESLDGASSVTARVVGPKTLEVTQR